MEQNEINRLVLIEETTPEKFSFDPKQYRPLPIPTWKPPKDSLVANDILVGYDSQRQMEILLGPTDQVTEIKKILESSSTQAYAPFQTNALQKIGPVELNNFTDLTLVSNPSAFPYSTAVKIFGIIGGDIFVASGVLIDAKHVLTAGHVVYDDVSNTWASAIIVVPAYNNGAEPFGHATAVQLYSWSGWTTNGNYDWDMGYILLDRPIGALTGWLGYGYNNDDSFFTNSTFDNPGYPAESPYDGELMYTWSGTYDDVGTDLLYIRSENAYRGQSGSGAHAVVSGKRTVYSELSHRKYGVWFWGIGTQTGFVRITSDKYTSIASRITSNTPTSFDWDSSILS